MCPCKLAYIFEMASQGLRLYSHTKIHSERRQRDVLVEEHKHSESYLTVVSYSLSIATLLIV